nr:M23 family metallopeptidase [Algicola sagamiensis]
MPSQFLKSSLVAGIVFSMPAFAKPDNLTLTGDFRQGHLIQGKVQPGSQVSLDGKSVYVGPKGQFVFGFGRDAKPTSQVKVILPNNQTITKTLNVQQRSYKEQKINGVEKKYVSPPKSTLARIKKDNARIKDARSVVDMRYDFQEQAIIPTKGPISGVYGSRRIFNGVPKWPHFGLDIAAKTGSKVVAPLPGKVTLADPDLYYSGGTIVVDHGFGITTTYLHLSKLKVKEGQWVKKGDLIGLVGATGRVTGPHLDIRLNWQQVRLDPAILFPSLATK